MKLIEAIKQKGKPFRVLNCGRNELPEFFKEMGYTVGAEVGVYKGEYTELFCKQGLKMYGIDPWHSYNGAGRTQQLQERQDFIYGHASRLLSKYNDCTLIRKTSMDAVNNFKDNSLDFVYIDGDHSFSHVANDIQAWAYKVRKGGIVSGHDYFNNYRYGVVRAVDAYTYAHNITKWYVTGGALAMDRHPSYFWVKK